MLAVTQMMETMTVTFIHDEGVDFGDDYGNYDDDINDWDDY